MGFYSLKEAIIDGQLYGDTTTITDVKSETNSEITTKYELMQNYPNPFNPSTRIEFILPNNAEVRINVYDILGEKIKDLLNKEMTKGEYQLEWDGKDKDDNNFRTPDFS